MTIDRRGVLRGLSRAAAAGALGTALAAVSAGQPRPAPPVEPLGVFPDRWAGVRPAVVPRSSWRTDAVRSHARPHPCAPAIRAVFVHHTDSGNGYSRADVPRLIQSFYDDHIEDHDWDDIGYNFLVDRAGTVYEGRAGGIDNAVIGAHTLGFNIGTVGIAAIGSFGAGERVPEPLLASIARLAAWKLGRYGVDARGRTELVSTSDEARFGKGTRAVFHTVSGHRDGYETDCPGGALYGLLPEIRRRAYALQAPADTPWRPDRPVPSPFPDDRPARGRS